MRVISGTAKGRKLKMVPGDTTRPIMDRVKENLFNIIGDWLLDTRWLDLFAGTGQVGIEALSRGAAHVTFVDLARPAVKVIHDNLKATHLWEQGKVVQGNAFEVLGQIESGSRPLVDLIYVAPPQYKTLWLDVMMVLAENPAAYLLPDGQIIVQIDPVEFHDETFPTLTLTDKRKYGSTLLLFYQPIAQPNDP